jgi:hypothetical protein
VSIFETTSHEDEPRAVYNASVAETCFRASAAGAADKQCQDEPFLLKEDAPLNQNLPCLQTTKMRDRPMHEPAPH